MKLFWESSPIKKSALWVLALLLALAGTAQARSKSSYESIMERFLAGDFAQSEKRAAAFHPRSGDTRAEEVSLIRALSLMKLGRFEEARPILEKLAASALSTEVRAQAAYSLGDSYYFGNDRAHADVYYRKAVESYPEHGEAEQVRHLIGLSSPYHQGGVEETVLYSVQVGSFSRRRNAERLLNKLTRNRYDAYISPEEASKYFRVRVGRLTDPQDAQTLSDRLKKDGYPTKIFP